MPAFAASGAGGLGAHAAAGVDGIEAYYARCVENGVTILRTLNDTPWGTKDFYVEDPDGYIVCFGGTPAEG